MFFFFFIVLYFLVLLSPKEEILSLSCNYVLLNRIAFGQMVKFQVVAKRQRGGCRKFLNVFYTLFGKKVFRNKGFVLSFSQSYDSSNIDDSSNTHSLYITIFNLMRIAVATDKNKIILPINGNTSKFKRIIK